MKEGIDLIITENINDYQLDEYVIDLFYKDLYLNESKDVILAKNRFNINYDVDNNRIIRRADKDISVGERRSFLDSIYNETLPIFNNLVRQSLSKYWTITNTNKIITEPDYSRDITVINGYVSFASYIHILPSDLPTAQELDMSEKLYRLLGLNEFIIRFANHISKQEWKQLYDKSNLKVGMIYAIDTQENIIKRFISNIIKSRNELMASILTSEHPIRTIEDIDKSVLDSALKFKKQGKF